MSEEPMTLTELTDMFGGEIPLSLVQELFSEKNKDLTVAQMRIHISNLAKQIKHTQDKLDLLEVNWLKAFIRDGAPEESDEQIVLFLKRIAPKIIIAFERTNSLEKFIRNPTKHVFWGAGEPDCPKDLKAGNGELHTLRCKVCGTESDINGYCTKSILRGA